MRKNLLTKYNKILSCDLCGKSAENRNMVIYTVEDCVDKLGMRVCPRCHDKIMDAIALLSERKGDE